MNPHSAVVPPVVPFCLKASNCIDTKNSFPFTISVDEYNFGAMFSLFGIKGILVLVSSVIVPLSAILYTDT